MRYGYFSFLLLMALVVVARPARSQPQGGRDERCKVAVEIVRTGDSPAYARVSPGYPAQYKLPWAYGTIRMCGASGATALAGRIYARRFSRDVPELSALTAPTRQLLDGNLFQTAARIAADPMASAEARIFAFRTLIWAVEPRLDLRWEGLTAGNGGCIHGAALHTETWEATPLPGNRRSQVAEVADRVLNFRGTSAPVRSAAACALREVRREQ